MRVILVIVSICMIGLIKSDVGSGVPTTHKDNSNNGQKASSTTPSSNKNPKSSTNTVMGNLNASPYGKSTQMYLDGLSQAARYPQTGGLSEEDGHPHAGELSEGAGDSQAGGLSEAENPQTGGHSQIAGHLKTGGLSEEAGLSERAGHPQAGGLSEAENPKTDGLSEEAAHPQKSGILQPQPEGQLPPIGGILHGGNLQQRSELPQGINFQQIGGLIQRSYIQQVDGFPPGLQLEQVGKGGRLQQSGFFQGGNLHQARGLQQGRHQAGNFQQGVGIPQAGGFFQSGQFPLMDFSGLFRQGRDRLPRGCHGPLCPSLVEPPPFNG